LAMFDLFYMCVTCRLVRLAYVTSICLFWRKVIYEKIPEQLSELPPSFYSLEKKKAWWLHPEWPDNITLSLVPNRESRL
jgi:hypothetical protein